MHPPHRPLGTVMEILQLLDLDVTHQYEDMVFVSHNLFIIKFTQDDTHLDLYFNEDIEEEKAQRLMGQLEGVGELHGMVISYKGAYTITENEDESVSVEFFDLSDEQ
jgi:hypothetical protein